MKQRLFFHTSSVVSDGDCEGGSVRTQCEAISLANFPGGAAVGDDEEMRRSCKPRQGQAGAAPTSVDVKAMNRSAVVAHAASARQRLHHNAAAIA